MGERFERLELVAFALAKLNKLLVANGDSTEQLSTEEQREWDAATKEEESDDEEQEDDLSQDEPEPVPDVKVPADTADMVRALAQDALDTDVPSNKPSSTKLSKTNCVLESLDAPLTLDERNDL